MDAGCWTLDVTTDVAILYVKVKINVILRDLGGGVGICWIQYDTIGYGLARYGRDS